MMEELISLFKQYKSVEPTKVEQIPLSGSNRRYYRLFDELNNSLIGVEGTSVEENIAFIRIAQHFYQKGLNVPQVYAYSADYKYYIQEDLGSVALFDLLQDGRKSGIYSAPEIELLKKTISYLPQLQFSGAEGLDFSVCYQQPEFDERMIFFDLNYFKYCFLKATNIDFSEIKLEDDFRRMSEVLMNYMSNTFLYRDFQARNVMIKDGQPYFIDFQGGRKGPIYYDIASFLWQAKAKYPSQLREELIDVYINSAQKYISIDKTQFREVLRHFVLFRTLQVLGAYGFRGYFERKPHFLESIPHAINNLKELLNEPFEQYPYLTQILQQLTQQSFVNEPQESRLKVEVYSFSYKKGLPYDKYGNGGGYIFDCRSIHNPGRYEQYKKQTGLDGEVIEFLETKSNIAQFLNHVYSLVDEHVECYIERGFSNLMVCFGCTGGQHRSAYCAEHLAAHLKEKYDIDIELIHRELNIKKVL